MSSLYQFNMNKSHFVFFVFLLLYVKLNSAIDCAAECSTWLQNTTEPFLADLVKYEAQIEQLKRNLEANATKKCDEAETKKLQHTIDNVPNAPSKCDKPSGITAEQFDRLAQIISEQLGKKQTELKEQLTKEILKLKPTDNKAKMEEKDTKIAIQEAKLNEQQLSIDSLLLEKKKFTADLNEQQAMINGMKDTINTLEVKLKKQQLEKDTLLSEKNKCTSDLKELKRIEQESKTSTQHDGLTEYIKTVPAYPLPRIYKRQATSCRHYPNSDSIETIRVPGMDSFEVLCNSRFRGGGRTVIMRKFRNSINFDKTWNEYKNGFGNLNSEFWIGLDKLHLMTKFHSHEMIVFPTHGSLRYSNFTIANEAESYKVLTIGSLLYGNNVLFETKTDVKFTTRDRDNDNDDTVNCAQKFELGWWFDKCPKSSGYIALDDIKVLIRPTSK